MKATTRRKRGDATRDRVIAAAIECFGRDGLAQASTRSVVEQAGANLVSIHYHFGSKDQLYCAAAAHIAENVRESGGDVLERARTLAANRRATRAQLVEGVCEVYETFLRLMLGSDVPDAWMRFVVREQLEPTATGAFERLFGAIRPFFEAVHALVARLQGRTPADVHVRLTAMMLFGHIYVLRINARGALAVLNKRRIGPAELRTVRAVAREHIRRVLLPRVARRSRVRRG